MSRFVAAITGTAALTAALVFGVVYGGVSTLIAGTDPMLEEEDVD